MYSLNIHCRKNTYNALEHWRIQIYTQSDLHSFGNVTNQPNKSTQVIMRRPVD